MVSIHVPVSREPPLIVLETLNALASLDYPNYEVIVISNNTKDENLWYPVKIKCQELNLSFYHFDSLPGYKAGALNKALHKTREDVELIGIVDADNIAEADFLRRVVGFFDDSQVGFCTDPSGL